MKIWFDMDGTFVDLYGVDGWLEDLRNERTRPYEIAKPLVNLSQFAYLLNSAQRNGYKIGIISCTAKNGSDGYNYEVATAKMQWLRKHLPSVNWDTIKIVKYGTNKFDVCGEGILFDDEEQNRKQWKRIDHIQEAFSPKNMLNIMTFFEAEKVNNWDNPLNRRLFKCFTE